MTVRYRVKKHGDKWAIYSRASDQPIAVFPSWKQAYLLAFTAAKRARMLP